MRLVQPWPQRGEMAQKAVQLDREAFCCSICLDLLKDPVTIPCGHSYCKNCIKTYWNEEDQKGIHNCPQCRQTFRQMPVLKKNTMLAVLVEQLKKTKLQVVPADLGPEDVVCDVCTERKLRAVKSCLVCLASFCEKHLHRHCDSVASKKHKLVEPFKSVCSCHGDTMMFCHVEQKYICYLCSVDENKGHDTGSATEDIIERQKKLQVRREEIQQRILDQEKSVKLLQKQVEVIDLSADKTVEESEKIFTELICLIQKRSSDVKQQISSWQETEVSHVKELQEKLEQEINELRETDTELERLLNTEDPKQLLHSYPSPSALTGHPRSSSINVRPLRYFEEVLAAVVELKDKLQNILTDQERSISPVATNADVLLSQPEPKSRADFLKYFCKITLDPNTAHTQLLLSEGNRKVNVMKKHQSYIAHPDRFTGWCQVLSRELLTGRCYWEVEWRGREVSVAVAYKNISRAGRGNECVFGRNDKSWTLFCSLNGYKFWYNNIKTPISGPQSFRVGVYLDQSAGILCFYSISETMTLLHRVQTTFTQPLCAGLWIGGLLDLSSAEFCKLG
ncbi:tripartite motif-containing protein 16-like [Austrofundulus limnaeus]|uniref:Tripartite motif-containing protein 16-like n=1 Tax=Austrofundulus limnaeus TaxID=52670 RepID=A0A2I4C2D4_AUSLI|nr:PREDICTED: tripartite motif-containing protein 16-like [Austrofundulus limnaeus]